MLIEQQTDMLIKRPQCLKTLTRLLVSISMVSFFFSCQKSEYEVSLHYVDVTSGKQLPYATVQRLDLTPADSIEIPLKIPDNRQATALVTTVTLGNSGQAIFLLLAKSDPSNHYFDQLYIDRNKDRDFTNDGAPYKSDGQFVKSRNQHFTEFGRVALPYDWQQGNTLTEEPFLCKIYFWYPDLGQPKTCSLLRLSWREGSFQFNDQQAMVAVVDDDANGVFDASDRWALLPQDSLGDEFVGDIHFFREATRAGWLGETAFEVANLAPQGNKVLLRRKEHELSRQEDLALDTPYNQEVRRPRAASEINWLSNYNRALQRARRTRQNIFVTFCVPWSGPCVSLDSRTFNDAEVVSLSNSFVCLQLDGDLERTLVRQFSVQNYPTLLILDHTGKELTRVVGYQPAAELARYLKQYVKS